MTETTPQPNMNETLEKKENVSIKISDIYVCAQALEMAIKRKVFNEDEIKQIYPVWSDVIKFCEDVKRKTEIEELYKKTEEEKKAKLETVKEENLNITPEKVC
jgi:hypothetical protein